MAAMLFALIRAILLLVVFLALRRHGALGLSLAFAVTYVLQTAYVFPYILSILRRQANDGRTQPDHVEAEGGT
jgi:hypothetical protein